jgi:carbonic anhydrase
MAQRCGQGRRGRRRDALKTPLIMVLGSESCGAMKATPSAIVDKATLPGHPLALVAGIAPAAEAMVNQPGDLLLKAPARELSSTRGEIWSDLKPASLA